MTTRITPDDFAKLSAPFAAKDHEFNRGFIYIEETAICGRIEEVDLSWEWKVIEMTFSNGMATVVGALTICGVTRYGTGQQLAQLDANGTEKNGEAYKGATTDAMKRAARLFGIGRYLLQCPSSVKDYGPELDKWLKSIAGGQSTPQVVQAEASDQAPAWWKDVIGNLRAAYKMTDDQFDKFRQIVKANLDKDGLRGMNAAQAMAFIQRTMLADWKQAS